ncbi:MAG: hypothetical protein ABIG32_02955 [Candidatus Uhrbacteria bacterium]|nr:hypothetical protein [Patescibacteria group bacterium]
MKSFWILTIIAIVIGFVGEANAAKLKATNIDGELVIETVELAAANPRQLQRVVESLGNYELQTACADVWRAGGPCFLNVSSTPLATSLSGSGGYGYPGYGYGPMYMGRDPQRDLAAAYRMQNPGAMMMGRDQATLMYVDAYLQRMWTIEVLANIDANSMAVGQVMGDARQIQGEVNQVREDQRDTNVTVSATRAGSVSRAEYEALVAEIERLKDENAALSAAILETNSKP